MKMSSAQKSTQKVAAQNVITKLFAVMMMAGLMIIAGALLSQSFAQMQVERLNRGLISVRVGSNNYLSWRLLADEPFNTGFNVYRGETRLNNTPIAPAANGTGGATIYTDNGAAANAVYTVRAVINGVEQAASEPARIISNTQGSNAGYIQINLQRPPTGAQGGTYSPGDASVGDLDGDGEYEIVLKWDPSNQKDNSQDGITDNVLIDAYRLDGTRLWRIDLGPNIRAGAHYTQFMVYDFDGDGKAEIMMKTAEGTRQGTNSNTPGAHIRMGPAATGDHSAVRRNSTGYILTGPEYLTVFNGETGAEMATISYNPPRGTVSDWGDSKGNRVDRFNAAVAYLDGERPSAVFQRGYYTRLTLWAVDWRNGQLTQRWFFDSGYCAWQSPGCLRGMGNHQLSVADVDNDGDHDIITGSGVVNSDGTVNHSTGLDHGDALHVAHMIKGHPTPQIFMPHECCNGGVLLRHANNGQHIFHHPNSNDIGRGCAAELQAGYGFVFWASSGMGLYDITGARIGNVPYSINHVIWWDGELSRELLDGNEINKWRISNNSRTALLTATGYGSVNGSKSNPVLQADLFGDWREEVIFSNGTNALRIYTTTMPTTHRLVTMMHDPKYRVAIAWQNVSYNQPPHPGYYIASDMNFPPPTLNVAVIGGGPVTPPPENGWYIGSGEFIDSLRVFDATEANRASWSVNLGGAATGLNVGSKVYGDRAFTATEIPAQLQGAEWIGTSMEGRKLVAPVKMAEFRMKKEGTVFILHEDRVPTRPAWIEESGFEETFMSVTVPDANADRTFTVYARNAAAGEVVTLGINTPNGEANALMYLVAVTDKQTVSIKGRTFVNQNMRPLVTIRGRTLSISPPNNEALTIRMIDVRGRVRARFDANGNGNFSLAKIPAGRYFVDVRGAGVKQTLPMVVK